MRRTCHFPAYPDLRPDIVMDMSLVRDIHQDEERQALVLALVRFSQQRCYQLIAEGIETEEELAMLRSLGVCHGQGFLLGRPAPVETYL